MGKLTKEAEAKANQWLQRNGFDDKGYTYVLIGIDSYSIKDELKEAGWVYNPTLRWHKADPGDYPNNVKCFHWSSLFDLMAWGDFVPFPNSQEKVDEAIADAMPDAEPAEYMGEPGDKFFFVPCTLTRIGYFQGKFGLTSILSFLAEGGYRLTWFTTAKINLEVGDSCFLSGTIKEQKEWKGTKSVIVSRCKVS